MNKEFLNPNYLSVGTTSTSKNRNQAIVETASVIAESHHQTDLHNYLVKNGKLWSDTAKQLVEEVTLPGPDLKFLLKLQDWTNNNTEGMAVWVSPSPDSEHPDTKISAHEIWTGRYLKMLKKKEVLVNIDALEFANALKMYSVDPLNKISSDDELREELIIITDKNEAISLIESVAPQENERENYKTMVKKSKTIYDKNQDNPVGYAQELQQNAGNFKLGCETVKTVKSHDKFGSLEFNCPRCKAVNTRPVNVLLRNCQYCNADVTC